MEPMIRNTVDSSSLMYDNGDNRQMRLNYDSSDNSNYMKSLEHNNESD